MTALASRLLEALKARWLRPNLVTFDAADEITVWVAAGGDVHVQFGGDGSQQRGVVVGQMLFKAAQLTFAQSGVMMTGASNLERVG